LSWDENAFPDLNFRPPQLGGLIFTSYVFVNFFIPVRVNTVQHAQDLIFNQHQSILSLKPSGVIGGPVGCM